jgi:hypothetical protein
MKDVLGLIKSLIYTSVKLYECSATCVIATRMPHLTPHAYMSMSIWPPSTLAIGTSYILRLLQISGGSPSYMCVCMRTYGERIVQVADPHVILQTRPSRQPVAKVPCIRHRLFFFLLSIYRSTLHPACSPRRVIPLTCWQSHEWNCVCACVCCTTSPGH